MTRVELLVIDPQRSFTDPPLNNPTENEVGVGSLFVPGANEDMERLASFIKNNATKFDDIHVTLDSHHKVHIGNPIWFRDPNNGDHPKPFTSISNQDLLNGKWITTNPGLLKWSIDYTEQLEKTGKYQLITWPEHCIIATAGANVNAKLFKALNDWEEEFAVVDYVTKGSNIYTENYSVFRAEVPRADDPTTQLNTRLVDALMKTDILLCSGEALSHCVLSSLNDLAAAFGNDDYVKKMVLLTDCCSTIPGYEKQVDQFLKEMTHRGMQLSTTDKFFR
jgi:nicotinamidase/pyrazinamidase